MLRESSAGEDGAATVQYLKLSPAHSGSLTVQPQTESTDAAAVDTLMLKELGVDAASLEQRHSITGRLILYEVIVITSEGILIRTANFYDSNTGDLDSVCIQRQRRVE
eukprot:Lankesteria_metandrocarpae@DN2639_c0_g1_i1.p1